MYAFSFDQTNKDTHRVPVCSSQDIIVATLPEISIHLFFEVIKQCDMVAILLQVGHVFPFLINI